MSPWMKWMRTTLLSSLVMYSMLSRLITLSPTRSNLLMVHLLPPKPRAETLLGPGPVAVLLVLFGDGLANVLPHRCLHVGLVLGVIGTLQGALQGVPPALGIVALEACLDPRPRALELEALLKLLGHLGLQLISGEYLGDDLIDPAANLCTVDLSAPHTENLLGRDHLGFDAQLLEPVFDVRNGLRRGEVVELEPL